ALLFIATAAAHVESFRAGRADLGSMVQAVWSVSHGHLFESTTVTGREMSRLGIHVDPFLALLAPLWWLWSSPLMLLVVQAAAAARTVDLRIGRRRDSLQFLGRHSPLLAERDRSICGTLWGRGIYPHRDRAQGANRPRCAATRRRNRAQTSLRCLAVRSLARA